MKVDSAVAKRFATTRAAALLAIASLGIGVALQLVMTPVLLGHWNDEGYALFIAIQGFAGYISVADAGIQAYLSQRLATLRARGEAAAADALTRGGLRAFIVLACVGSVLVLLAFVMTGHRVWSDLARACGAAPLLALVAAFAQVSAGATSLAAGGWSTSVDCGHGRYLRIQVFGLCRTVLTVLGIVVVALAGVGPVPGMVIVAAAQILFEFSRYTLTRRLERPATEVMEVPPTRRILHDGRGSMVMAFAMATQNGVQPYVTAALSAPVVSFAVPGRTLANGARTVSTAIANVTWVPVAARFAELRNDQARHDFWRRNAPVMSVIQLAGVAALLGLAPLVVPMWLPQKSAVILRLLPWYCIEQGAYAASIPATILASAVGRFGMLGVVNLVSAGVSIGATLLLVPTHGAAGFASANAVAAALVLAPSLLFWEWRYWHALGVKAGMTLAGRGLMVVAMGGVAFAHWRSPPIGVALCVLLVVFVGWGAARHRWHRVRVRKL